MNTNLLKKLAPIAMLCGTLFITTPVFASDLIVSPDPSMSYGGHEIWANGEIGQSFVAQAAQVTGGFMVEYDPTNPNLTSTSTQVVVNLYSGEGLNTANLLSSNTLPVDTTTKGFLDVDYLASGVTMIVGNTYTIGISSPTAGWFVPSVCTYPASQLPTGAYDLGHPFLQGQMVVNEAGICDNAFHFVDQNVVVSPTPTPTPASTPTPTPTPSTLPVMTNKKTAGKGTIMAVDVNSITVNKIKVYFTTTTIVKFNYVTSFAISQRAEYSGYKNADGSVTATKIEVR